jgi:hopanoid biosynthesis associated protein HpnK
VEKASREGILTCTSLMMGAPATADAVARARRLPRLRVGLHLNLVEGPPVSPADEIPDLLRPDGTFDANMLRAGIRFFVNPAARRQLAREIRAQFAAFRATGLALDHVNSHCHMHVHPTVAGLVLRIGGAFGMRAMRVPEEPWRLLRRLTPAGEPAPLPPLDLPWVRLLRRRLRRAGLARNDRVFGIAWSGRMTERRMLSLIGALPDGASELYCHPAIAQTPRLKRTMPDYRPADELAALTSAAVRGAIERAGIELVSYAELAAAP